MKKTVLITVAALVLTVPAIADRVEPVRAAESARGMLGMSTLPVMEEISLRASGRNGHVPDPDYYVFNNPDGGWAIIAADDRVSPVIAYSLEGRFSSADMPDNLKWWMDGVTRYINLVRDSDIEASAEVKAAWAKLSSGAPESEKKELITAKWDQAEPYNNLCPIVNGENQRALTGCVANAMAIIMQYNRWPVHGKGIIGGYTSYSDTYIPAYSIDGHYYDWDIMSGDIVMKGNVKRMTDEQIYQIARLVHDCGVSVKMDYSSQASGTTTGLAVNALKNNMSYSESIVYLSRSSYSLDQWFSIMKNEIDNGRVVLYNGSGDAGGHAFVCDGYDTDGSKIHINWGWGYSDEVNGYYTLDLCVDYLDVSFPDYQGAVVGIAPDTTDVVLDVKPGLTCICYDGIYGIEPIVPADIRSGAEFQFYMGWLRNDEDRDVRHEFKICLMDKDGNVRQEGWHLSMDFPASNGYFYADRTEKDVLTVDPDLTDYFQVFYKNGNEEWAPLNGNRDILPDVDGVICGVMQDPVILVPDNCSVGRDAELSLSLGFTHVKSVKWILNGKELEGNVAKWVSGKNEIRAEVEYLDESTGYISRTLTLE